MIWILKLQINLDKILSQERIWSRCTGNSVQVYHLLFMKIAPGITILIIFCLPEDTYDLPLMDKSHFPFWPQCTFFCFSSGYPIVSIEDPFDKEDWEHTKYFSGLGICQVSIQIILFLTLIISMLSFLKKFSTEL